MQKQELFLVVFLSVFLSVFVSSFFPHTLSISRGNISQMKNCDEYADIIWIATVILNFHHFRLLWHPGCLLSILAPAHNRPPKNTQTHTHTFWTRFTLVFCAKKDIESFPSHPIWRTKGVGSAIFRTNVCKSSSSGSTYYGVSPCFHLRRFLWL